MSDRSRSSFRAKALRQVSSALELHTLKMFLQFFSDTPTTILVWNCLVMVVLHIVVFFFSSSVKIDRNIHACVYVCALRPPREASMRGGRVAPSIWQDLKKQNVCFTIPHFLNKRLSS